MSVAGRRAGVAKALRAHAEAVGDVTAYRHAVQVTSYGGTGTTALCDLLTRAGLQLPDSPGHFPFKHERQPPTADAVPDGFRVLYVVGDPRNAVLSIFRRGIQLGHYRWLRMVEPDEDVLARLSSIESFLAGGVDEFQLEDHFARWAEGGPRGYPVMVVQLESLERAWPAVCEFFGLPAGTPGLPPVRRGSDWRSVPAAQQEQLEALYGSLVRRIELAAPYRIVE